MATEDDRDIRFASVASAALGHLPGDPSARFIALELDDALYGFNATQAVAVAMGLMTLALEVDPRVRAEIEAIVGTGSGVVKTSHDIEL